MASLIRAPTVILFFAAWRRKAASRSAGKRILKGLLLIFSFIIISPVV